MPVTFEGKIDAPHPIGNGPQMDPRPPSEKRRVAWLPVRAGAPLDGSKKAGWVWLMTVEVVVEPVRICPPYSMSGDVGGVYRKLPRQQPPVFPTLANDLEECDCNRHGHVIATKCIIHGCQERLRQETAATQRQQQTDWRLAASGDIRPLNRGEADQFGGPRIVRSDDKHHFPEGGD